LERSEEVLLDFSGIESIGKAFADEIFRVYAANHREIKLIAYNVNEQVNPMIRRILAEPETATPNDPERCDDALAAELDRRFQESRNNPSATVSWSELSGSSGNYFEDQEFRICFASMSCGDVTVQFLAGCTTQRRGLTA
jgi:STAS-like domain of unknown function (DUF4325)/Putative addiction module component